jgi:hypothetical protein
MSPVATFRSSAILGRCSRSFLLKSNDVENTEPSVRRYHFGVASNAGREPKHN